MVVVIIGIVAAIAVPRISRAGQSAKEKAILGTVSNVSSAIDLYHAEHGRYPGYNTTTFAPDNNMFVAQLTKYSNKVGEVSDTPSAEFLYGPYLRAPFPTNPINGLNTVKVKKNSSALAVLGGSGWIAYLSDGTFKINATVAELQKVNLDSADIQEKTATIEK